MQYSDYTNYMTSLLAVSDTQGQTLFSAILPEMIAYAELRMYRELDLIDTVEAASMTTTAGSRNVTLPPGMIDVHEANFITPAVTAPDAGVRNPMLRVSLAALNYMFPNATETTGATPSIPVYYARLDFSNIRLGGCPDGVYDIEFIGTIRPPPLSPGNVTTILTTWFPDAFVCASMVFGAGYQRDVGVNAMAPGLADYWEAKYKDLMAPAHAEELRKKALADPMPGGPPMMPTVRGPTQGMAA